MNSVNRAHVSSRGNRPRRAIGFGGTAARVVLGLTFPVRGRAVA